jgi:glycosyltransferase involved in cell wall biosynthesis
MNINNLHNIKKLRYSKAKIAILITAHNSRKTVERTLLSIYNQKNCKDYLVIVSDDFSSDNIYEQYSEIFQDYRVLYFKVKFKNVYKNRNFLLKLIYLYGHSIEIIVRCDSDDMFFDDFVLSKIEKLFFTKSTIRKACNFLLGGNTLSKNGKNTENLNLATNLLKNDEYLLDRLYAMSQNKPEYELPSCNFIFKKSANLFYRKIKSAEDHFLLVNSLLSHKNNSFRIDEDLLIINYSLSGNLTFKNKKSDYLDRRKDLYSLAYKRIICE